MEIEKLIVKLREMESACNNRIHSEWTDLCRRKKMTPKQRETEFLRRKNMWLANFAQEVFPLIH